MVAGAKRVQAPPAQLVLPSVMDTVTGDAEMFASTTISIKIVLGGAWPLGILGIATSVGVLGTIVVPKYQEI